jgi:hypothetical protein
MAALRAVVELSARFCKSILDKLESEDRSDDDVGHLFAKKQNTLYLFNKVLSSRE